ncbi:LysR family transcriptional regulator [Acidithiobacillus thiooxidans]|uniref:LysR family transcriptional regulator n=1 Tax=Acidithiobacillus thiooxidans TaxID=930 RepID=UPI001C071F57|nr:LysR family transcriptional regulator [Acidithiobacillus thiooxidans]
MEDLNDLYYYVQAVEHGGFAPAARAINLPKSKLSRRVAGLEERLGVRLIQRSTRHFVAFCRTAGRQSLFLADTIAVGNNFWLGTWSDSLYCSRRIHMEEPSCPWSIS